MARTTGWVITLLMLGGCTAPQQPVAPAPKPATPPAPEVVRYDRYLLINTHPDEAQRNPAGGKPAAVYRQKIDQQIRLLSASGKSP